MQGRKLIAIGGAALFSLGCIGFATGLYVRRNSLPSLKERFNQWLSSHYKTKEVEISGNPTHNLLVAYEARTFPLAFSVECGAYLNVLRRTQQV